MRIRCAIQTSISFFFIVFSLAGYSSDHPGKPCAECHQDILTGSVLHEPVMDGDCEVCHNASSGGLIAPREELCLICHDDIRPEEVLSPHDFFNQGRCEICHLPHASNAPYLLLATPSTVCESCHAEQRGGRSHPVGRGIMDPLTGGGLTCTSTCHNPHSSEYHYLLRNDDRELCRSCHKDKF